MPSQTNILEDIDRFNIYVHSTDLKISFLYEFSYQRRQRYMKESSELKVRSDNFYLFLTY